MVVRAFNPALRGKRISTFEASLVSIKYKAIQGYASKILSKINSKLTGWKP